MVKEAAIIPDWWQSRVEDVDRIIAQATRGQVETLARSPGGRPVHAIAFGDPEPHLRGPANFNSAMGARNPNAFVRRAERERPVLVVLAGVHGMEVEGVIGALSLIRLLDTGADLRGNDQPALRKALARLRVVVIPLANPDGRARIPYGGFVGVDAHEMHRVGQGTRADGSNYNWPGCKAVHPMTGDVGFLGAYFDDNGVNLMHDEWPDPMSEVTRALCRLVRAEAPDIVLNCHSYELPPGVLSTAYVPMSVKARTRAFAERYIATLAPTGLPANDPPAVAADDGAVPPALNLTSMLYHCGTALPLTFESPMGLSDGPKPFDYDQILDLHHVLYGTATTLLLGDRAR